MHGELLAKALSAETSRDWNESFSFCRLALDERPRDPDSLNLLGRLCSVAGDSARAVALQSFVLRIDPNHERAKADRAAVLVRADTVRAEAAFARALEIEPDVDCHRRHPMSLLPFARMAECELHLRAAVEADPSLVSAHAAIGNLRSRQMLRLEAVNAYELAVMLEWSFADAHLALAGLYESLQNSAASEKHRHEALSRTRIYGACPSSSHAPACRLLILAADGGAQANAPVEFALNMERTALTVAYIGSAGVTERLPPHDVVMNAMEYLESSRSAIDACERLFATATAPTINPPKNLQRIARGALAETLAKLPFEVARTARVGRVELARFFAREDESTGLALLVRPIDTHRGEGLERIESGEALDEYLQRFTGDWFFVTSFVDYRSGDGFYRKYRAIVVDGTPYAYHLAISDNWMVHYEGSLMEQHAWMRAEEERFLRDPRSVVPAWDEHFGAMAAAVGLEYFGVDFTLREDKRVFVFEAGAAMLVHCRDRLDLFAYKYDYVPRIFDAIDRMIYGRLPRSSGPA